MYVINMHTKLWPHCRPWYQAPNLVSDSLGLGHNKSGFINNYGIIWSTIITLKQLLPIM